MVQTLLVDLDHKIKKKEIINMKDMKKIIIVITIFIVIIAVALLILLQYAKHSETDPSKEIFEVGHETTQEVNRTYTK